MSLASRINSFAGYSSIALLALACVFCTAHYGAMGYDGRPSIEAATEKHEYSHMLYEPKKIYS